MIATTPVQTKDTDKATPLRTQANFDRKQYSKEYYEKNKDKILQYQRDYYRKKRKPKQKPFFEIRHGTFTLLGGQMLRRFGRQTLRKQNYRHLSCEYMR
jgi:hypothetical protein